MEFNIANAGKFYFDDIYTPPFQIISYSNFLGESNHFKFDQNYRENYKDLVYYKNIINEKSNDTYLVSQMLLFYYRHLVKLKMP